MTVPIHSNSKLAARLNPCHRHGHLHTAWDFRIFLYVRKMKIPYRTRAKAQHGRLLTPFHAK
jgi:hypothetical protein